MLKNCFNIRFSTFRMLEKKHSQTCAFLVFMNTTRAIILNVKRKCHCRHINNNAVNYHFVCTVTIVCISKASLINFYFFVTTMFDIFTMPKMRLNIVTLSSAHLVKNAHLFSLCLNNPKYITALSCTVCLKKEESV